MRLETRLRVPSLVRVCCLQLGLAIMVGDADAANRFAFGSVTVLTTESATIELTLRDYTTVEPFYSCEFEIEFDPAAIAIIGLHNEGTISADWGSPSWSVSGSRLRIAHAGERPIDGTGAFLYLEIAAAVNAGSSSNSTLSFAEIVLNEGTPSAVGLSGTVQISGDPVTVGAVHVTPATAQVQAGGTLRLRATVQTNGNPSVGWTILQAGDNGTVLDNGLYLAPHVVDSSRNIVLRAQSRLSSAAFADAELELLPAATTPVPELWVLPNPGQPTHGRIIVSVGDQPAAAVTVSLDGVEQNITALGNPIYAYETVYWLGADVTEVIIEATVDGVALNRQLQF